MIHDARNYAKEGFHTDELISTIIQRSNDDSNILLVADPKKNFEWSYSWLTYLSINSNIEIYGYPINDNPKGDYSKHLSETWHSWFEGRKVMDIEGELDLIVYFNKKDEVY